MVGHTGVIPSIIKAVESVDTCLKHVVDAVHAQGGVCIITADHGNRELLDRTYTPTAHTTNPFQSLLLKRA